jgi:hypothetical protein
MTATSRACWSFLFTQQVVAHIHYFCTIESDISVFIKENDKGISSFKFESSATCRVYMASLIQIKPLTNFKNIMLIHFYHWKKYDPRYYPMNMYWSL